ncbi:hypothetical protein A1O3_06924 [Capronia epimyces CBS 606.96]|uniref:Histone deacetylase complex subunit SAP30 Sin3 binding domain-containing protein n=1 Tax=Capronia epimyces CBS 606.96 TaxID=1182542 RepID=W9XTH0_9EURO|nr:uncharacterized protein A1O3_06924 [Capronia epimyces CBS 606.96]EXJ80640.1 hypothetical protein A1O3_06924 [Capronia epimyces CBS 606.96]
MAPPRPRNVDDSRSEASSTVTNQKEKTALGPSGGSGVAKGRRFASNLNVSTTANKAPANATAAVVDADSKDRNLPRTEWNTMSTSVLRTYRIAHRLSVPSAFSHPLAELTYTSSDIALRAPSAVQSRRKLREQKHQRKLQQADRNGNIRSIKSSKNKDKAKLKDTQADPPSSTATSIPDPGAEQSHPSFSPSVAYHGPREPSTHLATAVRKHFNAQQLSEADTIARFIYVVQQNGRGVSTEGSGGDGTGNFIGSHGREVRKLDGPGGEVGFRLRFRP